jgi:hypothetical protein
MQKRIIPKPDILKKRRLGILAVRGDASATHSPTAASDCAPARAAATAASNNEVSVWRTPHGSRGSRSPAGSAAWAPAGQHFAIAVGQVPKLSWAWDGSSRSK